MSGMRDATVRQLQIFASAAQTLSFSRTGKELHLTQPAVSMQVKQLEHYAGMPLFERAKRRLFLTEAGKEMARYAQQVMRSLEDAEDAFAALRGLRSGHISVAVVSTAKYFAPKLIAMFSREHPEIEMKLSVSNREIVVQLLESNSVDLAIMGQSPKEVGTVASPFAAHPLVVVAPPDHPLARKRRVPLAALADETFLVRERGSGTRAAMEGFFAQHGIAARIGMEMSSNETIKQAVIAGLGLSFISEHTIGLELAARQLALVRAEGLPVMRHWNVVHRAEKRLSPAADAFKRFVLEQGGPFLARWPRGIDAARAR
ncbi:MAG TPA: LysR substrate-binding domain-containing protein [Anaeromyxobacteraceae bacterium]|nr:LysR substrate-binding domain-containing protein [Anaeromyxobacteraceae bacterium]